MEIRVPHLAEGVDSGAVVNILVSEGDAVKKDQTVLELETHKAVAEIPAPASGKVVKIHVREGDTVPVGCLLITMIEAGADKETAAKIKEESETNSAVQPAIGGQRPASGEYAAFQYESKIGFPPPASPSIRKMAKDLGIDLTRVKGTEYGGRITLNDIRNYLQYVQQAMAKPQPNTPAVKPPPASFDFAKWGPVIKKPMSPVRRAISDAMVDSWTAVPQVSQFDDVDITSLQVLRKKFAGDYKKRGGHLTLTPLLIKVIVETLRKNPVFNASIDETTQEVVYKEYFHIGIAVDTEHGLIVPVLRYADRKDLLNISKELAELAGKARTRKVSLDEMQGGTFSISNQGGIGGKYFTPIIRRPEVAVLGIGRAYEACVYQKGKIESRTMLPVVLSYDHRLIDGAQAAQFMVDFAKVIAGFSDRDLVFSKPPTRSGKPVKPGEKTKKVKS